MCCIYCKELSTLNWRHPDCVGCDTELVTLNKCLHKVATLKLRRRAHMCIWKPVKHNEHDKQEYTGHRLL
jgi:hypothetical protein